MVIPRQLAAILGACVALLGCGGDVCDSCGGVGGAAAAAGPSSSSTGSACTETTGELHGKVSTMQGAAPKAILHLHQKPADVPLDAKADDTGAYTVDLPVGAWTVSGESADGYCTTSQPSAVDIEACGSTALDVLLDECVL